MEALKSEILSLDEYLEAESQSEVRHEYIGGAIYAMAGAGRQHNRLVFDLAKEFDRSLAGKRCQVGLLDLKLRIETAPLPTIYYPDIMVTCDPRDSDSNFNRFPKLIVEVLSEGTERTDRIEKLNAYKKIPTLEEYLLVAQDAPEMILFRRRTDWSPETVKGLDQQLHLESIATTLHFSQIFQNLS